MPVLRVVVLWHQHQPFYKDLVTGEYTLPWVRLHALKDYYGMVKLLDEFPTIHQTVNLVPSLITQIQDYAEGTARDPFLRVAAKPAGDLTLEERRFALQYLFQANHANLIARYPRYQELLDRFAGSGHSPEKAEKYFFPQDFTDLQVLSQIAWFDEFFLEEPEIAALVAKDHSYSLDDQRFIIARERELIGKVLPAHAVAAQRGGLEISTSPFYHPILPLICDSNQGALSSPGLPLPQNRFRHPEDAREQLLRGLDLHEKVFGVRPKGVWPSEGSVSEEVLAIAHSLGVQWMATDEGVLGRTLGISFARDGEGRLPPEPSEKLYNIHRYEKDRVKMNLIFRDHTLSDLVGFVYSGMPAAEAANHLIQNIKQCAEPILSKGGDAIVPVILDGENAWEYYPHSGREFLRRFYDGLQKDPMFEAVTVSEAITRHRTPAKLTSLVPGSWINANFNVWIGAPEDNRSWDYLSHARAFYEERKDKVTETQRKLAFEELLIAEGSDWNWWYGPEHHSANDREFDELYRKHLSNVYQALGAVPPDSLSQSIAAALARPSYTEQTAFIHPRISGDNIRYFEWMGAATYISDRSSGSMHGKQFVLGALYAGIDEANLYGRLDFAADLPEAAFDLIVNLETWGAEGRQLLQTFRLEAGVENREIIVWSLTAPNEPKALASSSSPLGVKLALLKSFQFKLPLDRLTDRPMESDRLTQVSPNSASKLPIPTKVKLRFSFWQNHLPVDTLPPEGWVDLELLPEEDLRSHGG